MFWTLMLMTGCADEPVDRPTSEPTGDVVPAPGMVGIPSTCGGLEDAFWDEAVLLQTCSVDADCGQRFGDYSCGCTRDWVLRNDADPTHLRELGDALMADCDWGMFSTCDCPSVSGFACDNGQCGWDYQ